MARSSTQLPPPCIEFVQTTTNSPITNTTNAVTAENGQQKRNRYIELTKQELEEHLKYSQPEAARRLGVSLSTLKRRFYQTHSGMRWPYFKPKHMTDLPSKKSLLGYVINPEEKPTTYLDNYTLQVLSQAFQPNNQNSQHVPY